MAIDNQTTIARSDRFTRTVSRLLVALRVFWLQIAHAKIGKIDFNLITQSFAAVHMMP